jgi:hypothetical protein
VLFKEGRTELPCKKCLGYDPVEAALRFMSNVKAQGGVVVGNYVNWKTPVKCICSTGHECDASPATVRDGGNMCWECVGNGAQFGKTNLEQHLAANGFRLISEYVNRRTLVYVECSKNHKFWKSVDQLLQRCFCRICNPKSWGEHRIEIICQRSELSYVREFKLEGYKQRFDFCLSTVGVLMEFDGEQHFMICRWTPSEAHLKQSHNKDIWKMKLAFEHGFRMVRLDYTLRLLPEDILQKKLHEALRFLVENQDVQFVVSDPQKYDWLRSDFSLESRSSFGCGKSLK